MSTVEILEIAVMPLFQCSVFSQKGKRKPSDHNLNYRFELFNSAISSLLTCFCAVSSKDVMMLGAVGAYAWSGTVVHQKGSTVDVLPFSAFEETLQDRNHSSLLGRYLQSASTWPALLQVSTLSL